MRDNDYFIAFISIYIYLPVLLHWFYWYIFVYIDQFMASSMLHRYLYTCISISC